MAKRKPDEPKKGAPEWQCTFSDLMNLLLCFFVLLFSMSSVDANKWEEVVASMSSAFSIFTDGSTAIGEGTLVGTGTSQLSNLDEYYSTFGQASEDAGEDARQTNDGSSEGDEFGQESGHNAGEKTGDNDGIEEGNQTGKDKDRDKDQNPATEQGDDQGELGDQADDRSKDKDDKSDNDQDKDAGAQEGDQADKDKDRDKDKDKDKDKEPSTEQGDEQGEVGDEQGDRSRDKDKEHDKDRDKDKDNNGQLATLEQQLLIAGRAESQEMLDAISELLEKFNFADSIELSMDSYGKYVELTISGSILFDSGKADLKKESLPLLSKVGEILKRYEGHDIDVIGHTDSVPIKSGKYETNQLLSSARAISTAMYFVDTVGVDVEHIRWTGRGEYEPIASNSTAAGRALNRRVEIRIYNSLNSQ